MQHYTIADLFITPEKKGADRYTKATFPIRYGRYTEIKTRTHLFEFDLNGAIRFIRGLHKDWPHPVEWLKRTDGNDWVYYSTGAYNEVSTFLGEFYRPCLSYPSNSLWAAAPFEDSAVCGAMRAWAELTLSTGRLIENGIPEDICHHLARINAMNPASLSARARRLHQVIGSKITVLPPDTRHVDYQVIPVLIADGCLYQCDFCAIKTRHSFSRRSKDEIGGQIESLKGFYGPDLCNYNAVFLGNHDALASGFELIRVTAEMAFEGFDLQNSVVKNPSLYLFGSADAFLKTGDGVFDQLNKLPFYTYINIGLESGDDATLEQLGKPLSSVKVTAAFGRMLAVNRSCHNLEISANFLLGNRFAPEHYDSITALVRDGLEKVYSKGAIYLSPLPGSRDPGKLLKTFLQIKSLSRLPAYLYLIQRL